jgi:nucleotide-binding universal stress UspA family protein
MSYKTILVHADQSPHAAARIGLAATLAMRQEAHLVGSAFTGLNAEYYRDRGAAYSVPLSPEEAALIARRTAESLDSFEAIVRADGINYERRTSDDEAEVGLVLQARYADLVVLSQTDPAITGLGLLRQLPETLALYGGRPVLLVPYAGSHTHVDRHALVAWDGSRAATRAVTDALPLLRASARVSLAVFNPEQQQTMHGGQPGADIALYLARHGVKVEVLANAAAPAGDVGNGLLSLAADCGADLLVMGAYGHMRWREVVLGGATRKVLQSMTLPVLMSH